MARSKLIFGYSANDNNGEQLRDGMMSVENALSELYLFLSGGSSEVSLPNALPEVRGGTGVSRAEDIIGFVRKVGLNSFTPTMLKHIPVAYCTVGYGRNPKTTLLTTVTGAFTFIRLGVGIYKLSVPAAYFVIDAGRIHTSPDNYGNVTFGAVANREGNDITINVHPMVWDDVEHKMKPDTSTLIDVPEYGYMNFIVSNSLVQPS